MCKRIVHHRQLVLSSTFHRFHNLEVKGVVSVYGFYTHMLCKHRRAQCPLEEAAAIDEARRLLSEKECMCV